MTIRDISKWSILREVKERLANAQQGIHPSTEREYGRIVSRVPDLDWRAIGKERGLSKRTCRVNRAACRWQMAQIALADLRVSEDTVLTTEFVETHQNAPVLEALARDLTRDAAGETADVIARAATRDNPSKKCRKRSKRRSLRNLPCDWPWSLVHAMPTEDDRLVTMVAIATGCRPEELRLGIEVTRVDRCRVHFLITGAKVSPRTQGGQPWREVVVDACQSLGPVAGEFFASLPEPGRTLTVSTIGQRWQRKLERRARKFGWWDVSAYSFRHRLASLLKFDRFDQDAISQVLGHASDCARRRYGMSRYGGGGGHGVRSVETAAEVRTHEKTPSMANTPKTDGSMRGTDGATDESTKERAAGMADDVWSDEDLLGDFGQGGPSMGR